MEAFHADGKSGPALGSPFLRTKRRSIPLQETRGNLTGVEQRGANWPSSAPEKSNPVSNARELLISRATACPEAQQGAWPDQGSRKFYASITTQRRPPPRSRPRPWRADTAEKETRTTWEVTRMVNVGKEYGKS